MKNSSPKSKNQCSYISSWNPWGCLFISAVWYIFYSLSNLHIMLPSLGFLCPSWFLSLITRLSTLSTIRNQQKNQGGEGDKPTNLQPQQPPNRLLPPTHIEYLVFDVYFQPPGRPGGCLAAARQAGTPPAESSGAPSSPASSAVAHCAIPPPGDTGQRDAKTCWRGQWLPFHWPKNLLQNFDIAIKTNNGNTSTWKI